MNLFNCLLALHIIAGCIALITSVGALCTKKGKYKHRLFGRYFFYSMNAIFITAIPMALIKNDRFLFCIAIFSYYLAWTGWRYALRKTLPASTFDKLISCLMLFISLVMIGIVLWSTFSYQSIVLLVFGFFGGRLSLSDLILFRKKDYPKHERLINHVGRMIGGTIAVFTAVLVVNLRLQSEWIVWLGPTIIFLPLIFYWIHRIKENRLG